MARIRPSNFVALVLKSKRTREQDLLVTLLTQEQGKVLVVAKGVGQLKSTKRAALEAGNLIKAHLIETKSLSLLTQATLVSDAREVREALAPLKRFLLFLEILDRLLVSEEISMGLWQQIIYLRELFLKRLGNKVIRPRFTRILGELGFASETAAPSIVGQVNCLLDRSLCTLDYLTI